MRRVVEHGAGWTAGGMPPDAVATFAEKVRSARRDAGRDGSPRITALAYFALGDTAQQAHDNIYDYYVPGGPEFAEMVAGSVLGSADAVRGAVEAFNGVGIDELVLDPAVADPEQVDLLAEVALG